MKDEYKTKKQLLDELIELRKQIIETSETERKLVEDRLILLKGAIESLPIGITISDVEGKIVYTNHAEAEMHGYSVEELIGSDARLFAPPELWKPLSFEQLYEMGFWKRESVNTRKNGELFPVQLTSIAIKNAKGEPIGIIAACEDITERKQVEEMLQRSEEHFRSLIENSLDIVIILDKKGAITYTSPSIERFLGYKPEELLGKSGFNFILPGDLPRAMYDFGKAIITKEVNIPNAFRVRHKDGSERILEGVGRNLFDNPAVAGFVINARDVSERKQAEMALRASEAQLSNALRIAHLGHWEYDVASDLFTFNDQFYAIFRTTAEEVGGYTMSSAQYAQRFVHPDDISVVSDEIQKAIESDDPLYKRHIEHRIIYADGEIGYISVRYFVVKDDQGKTVKTYGANQDITERKKAEDRIEYLAYYDALTGLPNRTLFVDRLKQGLARADFHKRLIAVLIIDIDRFKSINDTYGTEIGDRVLKEVAGILSGSVREGDTVARLGSDEFGIVLVDIAHSGDIVGVVETIMNNTSKPIQFNGKEIVMTLSIGISVCPDDGKDVDELIKNAELAFSKAKQQGRKSYKFYTEDMNVKASELLELEKNLLNAIKENEFILHYQPYWDINTKKITGMEALIRWQSKDKGLMPPGSFIPVLEDTGMIIEVGEWILRAAIRQTKEWQDKGHPVVPVSVNLSLIQFRQEGLTEMVDRVIREHGFYPSLLTLEITESAFMQDFEFTRSVLQKFKDIGISISVDDFGTGYSSLSYLKKLPIDNLKIDISFIREIETDPDTASIVTAIISMAHTLNLKTIAEGVETEGQWKILRLLRCDMGQGYYYSKPLPAEDAEKMLIYQK
jgi:diguanylate cyclase (GGDEF)-like protein/PAS domain S-box-containing protein